MWVNTTISLLYDVVRLVDEVLMRGQGLHHLQVRISLLRILLSPLLPLGVIKLYPMLLLLLLILLHLMPLLLIIC